MIPIANTLKYGLAFGMGLAFSYLLTPPVRALARKLGMMDQPDARRIHVRPTPRGGGLAVLVAFHLAMLVMVALGWDQYAGQLRLAWWQVFLQATLVLAVIGFMDDRFGLPAALKLAGQVFVASLMYLHGYGVESLFGLDFPEWANFAVTLLWYVLLTNAFNLIDGLDGLATGLAMIASLGLAGTALMRGQAGDAIPYLVLAGAGLGFLRYNFNPASVFLGDTGSLFLGFSLASMSVASATKGTLLTTLAVPLLAMGVPLYDTLLAVWRRSVRALSADAGAAAAAGGRIMQPDKDHLHHRFLALGLTQRRVAALLYAVNVGLVGVALLLTGFQNRAIGIFLLAVVGWAYVMFRHLSRIEVWETGRLVVKGFGRPRARALVMSLYGLWDLAGIALSWLLVLALTDQSMDRAEGLQSLAIVAGTMVLFLLAGQVYERIWSRARLREYVLLVTLVVGGAISGGALLILFGDQDEARFAEQFALFIPLTTLAIAGVRVFWRVLQEFLAETEIARMARTGQAERVLAYGAGGRFQLFLREQLLHAGQPGRRRLIVGVADDDPNLRDCRVSGVPVLGTHRELAKLVRRHRVGCVMITADLEPARKRDIAETARAAGVSVKEWCCDERDLL